MRNKKYLAYINPYFVVSKGGNYTKHIYIGSRRIAYAVSDVDDANVKYVDKYSVLQQTIKDRYADFEVPYNGNYVNCQYYYHSNHLGRLH